MKSLIIFLIVSATNLGISYAQANKCSNLFSERHILQKAVGVTQHLSGEFTPQEIDDLVAKYFQKKDPTEKTNMIIPNKQYSFDSAYFTYDEKGQYLVLTDQGTQISGRFTFDSENDNLIFKLRQYVQAYKTRGMMNTLPVSIKGRFIQDHQGNYKFIINSVSPLGVPG